MKELTELHHENLVALMDCKVREISYVRNTNFINAIVNQTHVPYQVVIYRVDDRFINL